MLLADGRKIKVYLEAYCTLCIPNPSLPLLKYGYILNLFCVFIVMHNPDLSDQSFNPTHAVKCTAHTSAQPGPDILQYFSVVCICVSYLLDYKFALASAAEGITLTDRPCLTF